MTRALQRAERFATPRGPGRFPGSLWTGSPMSPATLFKRKMLPILTRARVAVKRSPEIHQRPAAVRRPCDRLVSPASYRYRGAVVRLQSGRKTTGRAIMLNESKPSGLFDSAVDAGMGTLSRQSRQTGQLSDCHGCMFASKDTEMSLSGLANADLDGVVAVSATCRLMETRGLDRRRTAVRYPG